MVFGIYLGIGDTVAMFWMDFRMKKKKAYTWNGGIGQVNEANTCLKQIGSGTS